MSIDLNAIEARHIAWYNDDDSSAEWPDEIDFVVSYEMSGDSTLRSRAMAHEIVREDVPALLAYARDLEARIADLQTKENTLPGFEPLPCPDCGSTFPHHSDECINA